MEPEGQPPEAVEGVDEGVKPESAELVKPCAYLGCRQDFTYKKTGGRPPEYCSKRCNAKAKKMRELFGDGELPAVLQVFLESSGPLVRRVEGLVARLEELDDLREKLADHSEMVKVLNGSALHRVEDFAAQAKAEQQKSADHKAARERAERKQKTAEDLAEESVGEARVAKREAAAAINAKDEAREDLVKSQRKVGQLEGEMTGLRGTVKSHEDRYNKLAAEATGLRDDKRELLAEKGELETQLAVTGSKLETAGRELETAERERDEARTAAETATVEANTARQELAAAVQRGDLLEARVQKLEDALRPRATRRARQGTPRRLYGQRKAVAKKRPNG